MWTHQAGPGRRRAVAGVVLIAAALLLVLAAADGRARLRAAGGPGASGGAGPAASSGARAPAARGASPGTGGAAGTASGPRALSTPPVDLGAVMEQVHFAFRMQTGAWRGGHGTYEVASLPSGELEVKPWHHPTGAAAAAATSRAVPGPRRPSAAPGEVVEGSPVRFAAPRLERGGALLADGPGRAGNDARGRLEIVRGEVTEKLGNGPDGVEQAWSFARRPEGTGDLEVRVALVSGSYVGETEAGLHFTGGELGVSYGHGTWIDALGVRTEVPARWDGAAVVLRVPGSVVDGSVFPAGLDPIIGPETAVDAPAFAASYRTSAMYPAVAWGGTHALVVWHDSRFDPWSLDVLAARVRWADGVVLDPAGIFVTKDTSGQSYPAVAWGGTDYLVVWRDARNPSADIYGARVRGEDGVVLDPNAIAITTADGEQSMPAVSSDGTSYLVVWEDRATGTADVRGARVRGSDGAVLDTDGIAIAGGAYEQWQPAVSWDGTNHLVVWADSFTGRILGARVRGADGVVLDAGGIAISKGSGGGQYPAVASDGTSRSLVAWTAYPGGAPDIYGARVNAVDGTVLDAADLAISTAGGEQMWPSVGWDGTGFFVAWSDARSGTYFDIYGARVQGSDGSVLDPSGIYISTTGGPPGDAVVAGGGGRSLVAWWAVRSNGPPVVYAARVAGDTGEVADPAGIVVSTRPNDERVPAVAWGGTCYLAAWIDWRSGNATDVYGARIGADGTPLDPAGIPISTAAGSQDQPKVASDGVDFLVAWQDARSGAGADIYAARVKGADGSVLEPDGILVSGAAGDQRRPAVSWDGTRYLVVWADLRSDGNGDIYGARVSAGGTVLDPDGIVVSAGPGEQWAPATASAGGQHLVVWQAGPTYGRDIYGARVNGEDGAVLDPDGILVCGASYDQHVPAVASDGTDYLVAWFDYRNWYDADVFAARVKADGTVLDPDGIAVAVEADDQREPSVASDGSTYLVAWSDRRSGTDWDVRAGRVSADGVALEPGGFVVSGTARDEGYPAVASSGPRRFAVLYHAPDPDLDATRIFGRSVIFDTPPVAEALTVGTDEDVAVAVTLAGTDADGDPLAFTVAAAPAHGTLSGSGATLTFTPAADFHGADGFTYVASDGFVESAPATVTIAVAPVNDAPVAAARSVSTPEDAAVTVTLAGTDVEGDALTFSVVAPPTHGTLSGTGASLTYAPAADFNGSDAFTFVASDGLVDSAPATVSVVVTPANDAPVALSQALTLAEDGSLAITLGGTDVDGDALSYAVVTPPAHGTLGGSGASRTYVPAANFNGPDAFTFVVNDGMVDSAPATVALTVTPVNDAPVAAAQSVSTPEDTGVTVTLAGTDVDGDALTFSIVAPPAHGTLSGAGATLIYAPAADYYGADAFTFVANDGLADSAPATVSVVVTPVNDAPVALSQALTLAEDGSLAITLGGADVDGDALSYAVVTPPAHGTLSGSGASRAYVPAANFNGPDAFMFVVNDGMVDSAPANIALTVTPVDEPTSRGCGCGTGGQAAPAAAALLGVLAFRRRRRR